MFGTVGKWTAKDGHVDNLLELVRGWQGPDGFVSMTVYQGKDEPNVVYAAVVFESREAYYANAESDSQNEFYTKTLEHLEGGPEWFDGDVVIQM